MSWSFVHHAAFQLLKSFLLVHLLRTHVTPAWFALLASERHALHGDRGR
jgi:hypothetical protein